MFLGYRSSDPVITICQDNAASHIFISEVNKPAQEILGYKSSEIKGKPFSQLIPSRIAALMHEYVEFDADGNDVGSVLSKVQSFCLVDAKGGETALRLKVLRAESSADKAFFKLILQSGQSDRRNEAFRAILRENFKGHEVIDAATSLPDRYSLIKDIEFVLFYVHKGELNASFALLELDGAEDIAHRHGKETPGRILKHIATLARQNLRPDDIIGSIPPHRLGLILLDTASDSARMVLNRLRWLIAANPYPLEGGKPLPLTVSIGFMALGGRINDKAALQDSEAYMNRLPASAGNILQEIEDIEIREEENGDRREQQQSVLYDRRKGERRQE